MLAKTKKHKQGRVPNNNYIRVTKLFTKKQANPIRTNPLEGQRVGCLWKYLLQQPVCSFYYIVSQTRPYSIVFKDEYFARASNLRIIFSHQHGVQSLWVCDNRYRD